jgi:hypothetical protein
MTLALVLARRGQWEYCEGAGEEWQGKGNTLTVLTRARQGQEMGGYLLKKWRFVGPWLAVHAGLLEKTRGGG